MSPGLIQVSQEKSVKLNYFLLYKVIFNTIRRLNYSKIEVLEQNLSEIRPDGTEIKKCF
jgi:hypothetical protein